MKKIIFAIAVLAMVFVSCSKDEDSEPSSSEIKLNITVANIGPDEPVTRASIKDVWVEGDQISIWYDDNTAETPDLVITYDGSEWKGPQFYHTPKKSAGYVKCLYDGRLKVTARTGYTYNGYDYSLGIDINTWTFLTELIVVVKDIPEGTDASSYTLACDKFTPLSGSGYTVGVDNITATTGTKGDAVTGFASDVYDGAAAFVFATSDYSTSAQDFTFTLKGAGGAKVFSESLTLVSTKVIKSINLAYSEFTKESTTDGHDWVQLWENGPKFATMNLGETTVTGHSI